MKKHLFWLILTLGILAAVVANSYVKRTMFLHTVDDGFYVQISQISVGVDLDTELSLVHIGRYFVAYPFLWLEERGFSPATEMALLFVFMLPLLTAKIRGERSLIQVAFVVLPYMFSFRSVLGMCGMSYLFLFLYVNRQKWLLLGSIPFANLGSGVMLAWVIIVLVHFRLVAKRPVVGLAAVGAAAVSLGMSVTSKYSYFQEQSMYARFSFGDDTRAFLGPVADGALANNTVIVSLAMGNYTRAAAYIMATIVMGYVVVYCYRNFERCRRQLYFFAAGIATVAVEGIAFVSFLVPMIWFLLYRDEWTSSGAEIQPAVDTAGPRQAGRVTVGLAGR